MFVLRETSKRPEGPVTIERKDQERIVKVEAGTYGRDLGSVIADVRTGLAGMGVPNDISVEIGGTAEDQAESFQWLLTAMLVGIALV